VRKLRVDLSSRQSVNGHMDEPATIDAETARLINELITRLGMLMEDASTAALLQESRGGSLSERVKILQLEITRMKSIAEAARAL